MAQRIGETLGQEDWRRGLVRHLAKRIGETLGEEKKEKEKEKRTLIK